MNMWFVGLIIVAKILIKVVFPAPFGPNKPIIPLPRVKSKLESAVICLL